MTDVIIIGAIAAVVVGYALYLKKKKDKNKEDYETHSNPEELVHDSGITLLPSKDIYLTFERIVEIYKEVELCTGLKAKGPTIEYVSYEKTLALNPEGWALYMSAGKRILINSDKDLSKTAEDQLLRHEMVHHLLSENGMSDESRGHASTLFNCGPGIDLHNGKVIRP